MGVEKIKCVMLYDDVYGMGHLPFFQYLCENLNSNYELHVLLWNNLSTDLFFWSKVIRIPQKSNKKLYDLKREHSIRNILKEVEPTIFFIDFFPFWRYWNILDINLICTYIKDNGWKNISIMRDIYLWTKILSDKSYTKFINLIYQKKWKDICSIIENDYRWLFDIIFKWKVHHIFLIQAYLSYNFSKGIIDSILVFWDKNIFNISQEFIVSKKEKKLFHHLWYISKPLSYNDNIKSRDNTILISTWGNVTSKKDFEKLIKYISNLSWYSIRILLWPYIERSFKKKIISIVLKKKNITISGFVHNFSELLSESSYFFWFWWYWTFQDLFNYKGQAFIMSNYDSRDFRHRYYEQKYRTMLLSPYLNVTYLNDFSKENLDLCFENNADKKNIKEIEFCSAEKLTYTLDLIYNEKL